MYRILFYDVVSDSRRARLHRRLKAFLLPVQKSAFEGWVDASSMDHLEEVVLREVDLNEDKVRIASLCARCAANIVTVGDMPRPPRPGELILLEKSDDDFGPSADRGERFPQTPAPGRSRVSFVRAGLKIVVSSLTSPMNLVRMRIQRPQGVASDP